MTESILYELFVKQKYQAIVVCTVIVLVTVFLIYNQDSIDQFKEEVKTYSCETLEVWIEYGEIAHQRISALDEWTERECK